jgi:hypothetical protein
MLLDRAASRKAMASTVTTVYIFVPKDICQALQVIGWSAGSPLS